MDISLTELLAAYGTKSLLLERAEAQILELERRLALASAPEATDTPDQVADPPEGADDGR